MNLLKLPLRIKAFNRKHGTPWSSCAPFVDNDRAMLLHRPKCVTVFQCVGKSHLAVECWCGSTFTGTEKFTFLDAYDGNKLLCTRCETNATEQGMPSADGLSGRHMHKGKLVVVQTCCTPIEVQP
jgi:hypothetical protein